MENKRLKRKITNKGFITGFVFLWILGKLSAQVYVAAPSGLSLRETADPTSQRIQLIPYGKQPDEFTFSYDYPDQIDGYSGYWCKAKYSGKTGYIFSGYTLSFPPPDKSETLIDDYLKRAFEKIVFQDSVADKSNEDKENAYLYRTCYENGIVFTYTYGYEWHEYSLINLPLQIDQTYLLVCLLDRQFQCVYKTITTGENELSINFPPKGKSSYHGYEIVNENRLQVTINTEHYFIKIFYLNGRSALSWGGGV